MVSSSLIQVLLCRQQVQMTNKEAKYLTELFRKRHPKTFFQATKTVIRLNKPQKIAKGFRTNDPLVTKGIDEYIHSHFFDDAKEERLNEVTIGHEMAVEVEEVYAALQKLSSNKAIGVDKLKDSSLKKAVRASEPLAEKLRDLFEKWINGVEEIPQYFMQARTIALSKEDGVTYPAWGAVRLIGVMLAITKLFELVLHEKLRKEISDKDPIVEYQRGFVLGKSTI